MNVITHQAPAEYANVMAERVFAKYLEVADPVLFGREYVLPIVAALCDVMRNVGDYESRSARHAR